VLSIIEKLEFVCMSYEAVSTLEFEEEIEICFEQMDDAELVDVWCPWIFFNENNSSMAPSGYGDSSCDGYCEELVETMK
jgi:hypothetical protein